MPPSRPMLTICSDEHQRRSPDCMFFTLSASSQSIRAQKGRPSKASRMSTKSNCTLVPDEPSVMDTSPHDSSMVSIPSSAKTTRSGKVAKKAKKAKAQSVLPKSEDTQLASSFIEAEDDDFEIKVVKPVVTKAKGKKRNSEDIAGAAEISSTTMPKKRRTTRTRNSVASVQAVAEVISETTKLELDQGGRMTDTDELSQQSNPATKKRGKKDNKRGSSTSRKASSKSIASEASLRAGMPNDEEIDAALERELDRPLTDDGEDDEEEICKPTKGRRLTRTKPGLKATAASTAPTRRTTRTSTITIDDSLAEPYSAIPVALESEKQMPDDVGKPLAKTVPVAKASKKTSTRKASAKQNGMDHAGEAVEELPAHADEQLEGTKQKQTRGRKPSYQVHTHGGHLLDPPVLSTGGVTISKSNGYAIDSSVKEDDSCHETDANTVGLTKRGKKASVAESTQRDKEAGPRAHVFEATVQSAMPDTIVEPGEAAVTPADGIDDLGSAAEESNRLTKKQRKSLEAGSAMMGRNAASKPLKGEEGAVDARTSEPAVREVEPSSPPATSIHSTPRPVPSPQSSDAENQPPSSRPSQSRPPLSFESPIKSQELRIPLAVITTPSASPSKGKFMKIQSSFPWTAMDIDQVFNGTPDAEKENQPFAIGANLLTSPEKKLTVEEWIKFKAQRGEERLRNDCERLVGRFEDQGVRALRTLEGIICVD